MLIYNMEWGTKLDPPIVIITLLAKIEFVSTLKLYSFVATFKWDALNISKFTPLYISKMFDVDLSGYSIACQLTLMVQML